MDDRVKKDLEVMKKFDDKFDIIGQNGSEEKIAIDNKNVNLSKKEQKPSKDDKSKKLSKKEQKAAKDNKNKNLSKEEHKAIKKAKRRKRTAVQLGVALVLVLVGALTTLWLFQREQDRKFKIAKDAAISSALDLSKKTLEEYVAYIPKMSYSKMYRLIDNKTKEKRAENSFIFVNQAFYKNIALTDASVEVKKCFIPTKEELEEKQLYIVDKYEASNTRIDCVMTVKTDGGEFSFDKTIDFVKEDGEWHLIWDSSIIYPDYMPMDVVKNSYLSALRGDILDRNGKKLATMKDNKRFYPYSVFTSHLTGFIARITDAELQEKLDNGELGYSNASVVGKKGLEYSFESKIKGAGGQNITLCDSSGVEKKKIMSSDPVQGENLQTTIDVEVQKALYEQIKSENACSVAINPYTGEILALVSTPAYNNNDVLLGKASDTYNRFARAFCPGSTFKPITGAVGLDCGAFTKDTNLGASPKRWQKDKSWGDLFITTQHQCKVGNLINGITISDNVYFAKAALKIGSTNLKNGLDKLGFNEQIPFEMNFAASQYSNTDTFSSEGMLANSGYGQGQILINPLHLASIYSAFLNKGNMVMPTFEYNGETKYWKEKVFKEATANTIKECLENVVKSGTGTGTRSYKMTIGGKTGTAEIKASQDDENGTELGWFVALTTDTKPEDSILIVTMIEDVEPKGGSAYVVSKTKKMLKAIYGDKF